MKFYVSLLVLYIVLLASGCKSKLELQDYDLSYINASIKIPTSYVSIDPDTLKDRISKIKNSSYPTNAINSVFNKPGTILLADTTNYHKLILISPLKNFIEIDSNSFYLIIDYQRKTYNKMYDDDSAYFFGSKMGSVGSLKYIDSQYLKSGQDSIIQCIYNSYIISTDNKSLGISFYSPYEQDVSRFINSIEKK